MAKKDDAVLSLMRHRLEVASDALSTSRGNELDDLRFYAGDDSNHFQWPEDTLATRGGLNGQTINARPCLTINKLPQHVKEVTNDQRQNRPEIKVIPADDKADVEVAEIFNGICRHIQYISNADVAYDTACENQVTFGEGYIRLVTEYISDDSFDQEIKIKRVRNAFSVYMDPMIQDPCGEDAEWCIITEDVTKEEFERQWPDATPIGTLLQEGTGDPSLSAWINEDTIRIAEYFYVDHQNATLNLYPGNQSALAGTKEDILLNAHFGKPTRSRLVDQRKVCWVKSNGYETLEERDWAGKYIPVVRVIGNEFEIEGQIYISGLVRNAKDAQRMYNYWVSQEAEMLALAPKAPFIGYGGQFEGYEQFWKTANIQNYPYLEVNADATDGQGNPLPLPQRAQPPMASSGLLQAKMGASDDIKATTGQYDSSLGQTSNERSGKAIMARERQTDTGTYHYGDNLSRAVRYIGRQCVDLIPKIYDTARVARIIGLDGETDMATLDPEQAQPVNKITDPNNPAITIKKIYNLGIGRYDVCVTTGPSYMTKRQEALEGMGQILQGNPELWKVAGDLFVKNMDWPGAQELSKRLAKTIPPQLMDDSDKPPALQAAEQQIQQQQEQMAMMHGMLTNISQSMEAEKLRISDFEAQVKAFDAETKRLTALQGEMNPEQVQQIVMGTIHSMQATGDLHPPPMPPFPPPQPPQGGGQMPPQQPMMPPQPPAAPPMAG